MQQYICEVQRIANYACMENLNFHTCILENSNYYVFAWTHKLPCLENLSIFF